MSGANPLKNRKVDFKRATNYHHPVEEADEDNIDRN
jgi:hypothetical protein